MPGILDNGFSITTLIGRGGDGKSYITVHDLAHNRLVRWKHDLWTNLPLHVEALSEYVAAQRGCKAEDVAKRIHIILDEDLERWANGHGGPWELCQEHDAKGDLIIDEAHVFCPKGEKAIEKRWQEFLGEARHYGLERVQFITQASAKVSPVIEQHCHARYRIEKGDRRRTRWFGIPMSDVYNLIASVTRRYQPLTFRIEEVRDANEKWQQNDETIFTFRPEVFALYESHSAAGGKSSTEAAATHQQKEFEKRPRLLPNKCDYDGDGGKVWTLPTWLWVVSRNLLAVGKVAALVFAILFMANGGLGWMLGMWTNNIPGMVSGAFVGSNGKGKQDAKGSTVTTLADSSSVENVSGCGCAAKAQRAKQLVQRLARRVEQDAKKDADASNVSGLGLNWIATADGEHFHVGDVVENGTLKGKRIVHIDFKNRRFRTDDSRWHRMQYRNENADPTPANVHGLLQEAERFANETGEGERRERSILVNRRERNATPAAAQHPSQGDGSLLRR